MIAMLDARGDVIKPYRKCNTFGACVVYLGEGISILFCGILLHFYYFILIVCFDRMPRLDVHDCHAGRQRRRERAIQKVQETLRLIQFCSLYQTQSKLSWFLCMLFAYWRPSNVVVCFVRLCMGL